MKVGSLCSGIGGFGLGLERAGMEISFQVEIDEWCRGVLAKHWPDVRRHDDLKTFPPTSPEDWRVDLICAGFPCPPVSVAGKRLGDKDDRWLWPEVIRVIRTIRPRWCLIENVPGLLSIDAGRIFRGILWDLSQARYGVAWATISAASVGAAHLRERVWIVAHANSQRCRETRKGEGRGGTGRGRANVPNPTIQRLEGGEPQRKRVQQYTVASDRVPSLSDTNETGFQELHSPAQPGWAGESRRARDPREIFHRIGDDLRDAFKRERSPGGQWERETQPRVLGLSHGISPGVVRRRIAAYGNAVVPQLVEVIGRRILAIDMTL